MGEFCGVVRRIEFFIRLFGINSSKPTGFWGSDPNFTASEAKHPKGELKARGICALTPKTPDSEFCAG